MVLILITHCKLIKITEILEYHLIGGSVLHFFTSSGSLGGYKDFQGGILVKKAAKIARLRDKVYKFLLDEIQDSIQAQVSMTPIFARNICALTTWIDKIPVLEMRYFND